MLNTKKLRKLLWKALARVKEHWNFSFSEIARLLHVKPSTIYGWKKRHEVAYSSSIAVINIVAIYIDLTTMFINPDDQILWLTTEHPEFKTSPLEFIKVSLDNLFTLRWYLDKNLC